MSTNRITNSFELLAAIVILAGTTGCLVQSGNSDGRVSVEGRVTINGEPVTQGTIFFDGSRSAGGQISNGQYHIKDTHGPHPGINQVRFSVVEPTGEFKIAEDGEEDEVFREILPDRFRKNTGIEVEFKARSSGKFDYDIQLDSNEQSK